jgi:hypothetical protein
VPTPTSAAELAAVASAPKAGPVPGYEVLEELGRGGMGIVYKARHLKLKRLVALKMIRAGAEAGLEELERFRREGEAVARLQHPNIIQIYEVGEHEGRPFFSLEYAEGGSLAKQLTGTPLSPRQAAELVRTLAEAMEAAHQRGIVHRDLKPANVLLQRPEAPHPTPGPKGPQEGASGSSGSSSLVSSWLPKIGDFGLAKQLDEDGAQTRSGAIMGTPSYMAPEQARGETREVGPACDIWALGAILYELLTGRPPFRGATALDTLEQVRSQRPVAPRRAQPGVPRDLETICLKCLHKEPHKRYATSQELADDLRRFLDREPIHARPVGLGERALKWARRRPTITVAVLLAVFALTASGWGYLHWRSDRQARQQAEELRQAQEKSERAEAERQREHIDYFVSQVRRRGEPKGIGALRAEDAAHRSYSLRFHSRNGVVERIDVVNGRGKLTTSHPLTTFIESRSSGPRRECSYHYKRDKQGRLTSEVAYDRRGQIVWSFNYAPGDTALASYVDGNGRPLARSGSGVSQVRFVHGSDGYEREAWFLDTNQRPRPNDNNVYGLRLVTDARGRVSQVTYLGVDGRAHPGKDGTAGFRMTYDEQDRCVEQAFLDAAGKPVRHEDGYHKGTIRYDSFGNIVECAFWDVQGQPARHRDGHHKVRWQLNETGEAVEIAYLGADNRPATVAVGAPRRKLSYDPSGNVSEEAAFDGEGRRVAVANGVSRWTAVYSEHGSMIEQAVFDARDQPLTLPDGYHRWTAEYDDRGNLIGKAFFDGKGRPVITTEGSHRWALRFDAAGRQIEAAYFGPNGRRIAPRDGVARWKQKFDEAGRLKEKRYFGVNNKLVKVPDGYAVEKHRYDELGHAEVISYFDEQGKPARHREGYYQVGSSWMQFQGSAAQRFVYFDAANQPTVARDGYGNMIVMRDARGNIAVAVYLDKEGTISRLKGQMELKIAHRDGYAGWRATYDEQNHQTEIAYFGSRLEPAYHRDGYARITRTFDAKSGKQTSETRWLLDRNRAYIYAREKRNAKGHIVEWVMFTADNRPALHADGYHIHRNDYDDHGRWIETAYFGLDGKLTRGKDGIYKLTLRRDDQGREVEKRHYGPDGKPILGRDGFSRWAAKYNERGQCTEERYFGTDDKPIRVGGGHARRTWKYDKDGRLLERSVWALDGKGSYLPWRTWDDRGRILEEAFFDAQFKPSTDAFGIHRYQVRYNAAGQRAEELYFDREGRPSTSPDKPARLRMAHDSKGKLVQGAWFDPAGQPALHRDGTHLWKAKHDKGGRQKEIAYFGVKGEPVLHRDGYARITRTFDAKSGKQTSETHWLLDRNKAYIYARAKHNAKGQMVEWGTFTADNRPALHPDGHHMWKATYDEGGRLTEVTFFGVKGEAVLHRDGYHKRRVRYNKRGQEAERAYFGTENKPILSNERFARLTMLYDERGNRKQFSYFGDDNKPIRNSDGVAKLLWARNAGGVEVKLTGFDEKDRPLPLRTQILSVNPRGLAERGGLEAGDVILTYDGKQVEDYAQFLRLCGAGRPPGTPQKLTILRSGETRSVTLPAGDLGVVLKALVLPEAPPRKPDG